MPMMLRRALEKGMDRLLLSKFPDANLTPGGSPVSPSARPRRLIGVKEAFLPLLAPLWEDIDHELQDESKMSELFISSHHVVGILGLPTLDVTHLYPQWTTLPMTRDQLTKFVKAWDVTKLQSETSLPQMGQHDYDVHGAPLAIAKCKEQLVDLADELRWVRLKDFQNTFNELRAKDERLQQLGELTVRKYSGLRRPRLPGYSPWEDPRLGVRQHGTKRKPDDMRSGLGSVYVSKIERLANGVDKIGGSSGSGSVSPGTMKTPEGVGKGSPAANGMAFPVAGGPVGGPVVGAVYGDGDTVMKE
jgi:hypothetical protein